MKMNKKYAILFLFVFLAIAGAAFAEDNTTTNTTIDNGVVVSNDTTVIVADNNTVTSVENQTIVADENATIEATADNSTVVDDNSTIVDDNSTTVAENTTETADDNSTKVEDDSANADDNSTVPAVPGTGIVDLCANDTPTITPDNGFLWGLKRAIENVDSALTLGKSAKAQKGLAHAKERLCEVQLMIQEKKLDAAAKAKLRYELQMNKTERDISGMENETDVEHIAERLSEQRKFIAKMNSNMIKVKGNLTDEQKAALQNLMASFNGSTNKVKVEVEAKREKLDIKVKAREEQDRKDKESRAQKIEDRIQNKSDGRLQKIDERTDKVTEKAIEKSNEAIRKAQEIDKRVQEKSSQRETQLSNRK